MTNLGDQLRSDDQVQEWVKFLEVLSSDGIHPTALEPPRVEIG